MSGGAVVKKVPRKTIKREQVNYESMKAHKWTDTEIRRLAEDILSPYTPDTTKDSARRIVIHFLSAKDLVRYRKEYESMTLALPYA